MTSVLWLLTIIWVGFDIVSNNMDNGNNVANINEYHIHLKISVLPIPRKWVCS